MKKPKKPEYVKSVYFAWREVGTTLDYRIGVNLEGQALIDFWRLEKQGWRVIKCFGGDMLFKAREMKGEKNDK